MNPKDTSKKNLSFSDLLQIWNEEEEKQKRFLVLYTQGPREWWHQCHLWRHFYQENHQRITYFYWNQNLINPEFVPDGQSSEFSPILEVFLSISAIFMYMLRKCSPVCHQWSKTGTLKTFLDHSRVSTSHRSPATNNVLNLNIRGTVSSNYSLKINLNNFIYFLLNIVESNHIYSLSRRQPYYQYTIPQNGEKHDWFWPKCNQIHIIALKWGISKVESTATPSQFWKEQLSWSVVFTKWSKMTSLFLFDTISTHFSSKFNFMFCLGLYTKQNTLSSIS